MKILVFIKSRYQPERDEKGNIITDSKGKPKSDKLKGHRKCADA